MRDEFAVRGRDICQTSRNLEEESAPITEFFEIRLENRRGKPKLEFGGFNAGER
jgi:hypothetical protein